MMYGREKSDSAIVAGKPTNKVVSATAEPVEPRAGAEGNANQQSTLRTQCRKCVSQALERIRQVAVTHPRWEPCAGIPLARICAGGGQQ
jgi:RNA-directed DNA polymerase